MAELAQLVRISLLSATALLGGRGGDASPSEPAPFEPRVADGCELTVELLDAPESIPPGSVLSFHLEVANPCAVPLLLDAVTLEASGPAPVQVTLFPGPPTSLPGGAVLQRRFDLPVPSETPTGTYELEIRAVRGGRTIATGLRSVDVLGPLPYPERGDYGIKAVQPDFWSDKDEIVGNRAGGVAMNLVWAFWEPTPGTAPCEAGAIAWDGRCFVRDAITDDAIREWTELGVPVTAIVYGVPEWARVSGCSPVAPGFEIFCAPVDAADYGRFVALLASRYNGHHGHGRIVDFVIHNEVNSNTWFDIGCGQGVPCDQGAWLDAYASSFNVAYDAVATHQPTAKVFVSLDHHFDRRFDLPSDPNALLSGMTLLDGLAARAGARDWRVAFHPYPPDLFSPQFGADDLANEGKVTLGSIGGLAGWLAQSYPGHVAAGEIHLTESGIHSGAPRSSEIEQSDGLCTSFRNVLGTPGIESYVYHRMQDNPNEGGLQLGLRREDGSAKASWSTWALANRHDVGLLSCGFEDVPFTRLERSFDPTRGHWASSRAAPSGFVVEQSWFLLRHAEPGTELLYECRVGSHNLLSPSPSCEGLLPQGPVGYAYQEGGTGRVALYRCRIGEGTDHFVSPDPDCEGQITESLLGFALE